MPILSDDVLHRLTESKTRHIEVPSVCDALLSSAQDLSWDYQQGVASIAATALPEGAISLITSIFSVSKNQSGLRLATYLNARELRDKLSLAVEMISAENWVAAVLMSWAFHLLTVGSIRKENPAVSTLAAYVGALLRPLATALCERKYPPCFYSQDDWSELFDFLRENGSSGQSTAALASIHQWAVQTYGCDPMPELIFQQVESTRIHANVIWPHELQSALARAAWISDDERTNHQVQVLLALGGGGLFRIGDLLSLTTGDIQVCDDGLRIHVNPGHGIHAGKSRSARRIVRISDPTLINMIKHWRHRRRLETGASSEERSLLFGDPHDKRKLYRMGQCVRLVNQLLKAVTADDRVSFHTLRHSVATSRLYELLAHKQPPKAVSPLDELCHEMGHAGRETIWSIYFHQPELALRAAVDRIPAVGIVHLEEAAFWLEMTPAAMRQRAHRASSGTVPAQSFYSKWLAELADAVYPKLHEPGELKFPTAELGQVRNSEAPRDLLWVRQALATIGAGLTSEAACLRLSCSSEELRALCMSIHQELQSIRGRGPSSLPLLSASANAEHALRWARAQLERVGWTYTISSTTQLQNFASWIERHADDVISREAAMAWKSMYHRRVLSLHDAVATGAMLRLMRAAKFSANSVLVRFQGSYTSSNDELLERESTVHEIRSLALANLGSTLRIESVIPRRGHPSRYLLISRSTLTPGVVAPSASLRMREFHGLLFSLCVYLAFRLKENR